MNKNVILIILILSTFFNMSFGQEQSKKDLLSPAELIPDFDYMLKTLEETHPNLYAYIPKDEFIKKTDEFRESINRPMSKPEFYKVLNYTYWLIDENITN